MTSWFKAPFSKKKEEVAAGPRPLLYMTTDDAPAAQYLDLLYSYLYAKAQGAPLQVYDQTNPISPTFGLFSTTFEDCPGVTYIESRTANASLLNKKTASVVNHISKLTTQQIRSAADEFYKLKTPMITRVIQLMGDMSIVSFTKDRTAVTTVQPPAIYNAGLYIPPSTSTSGRTSASNVGPYLTALRALQKRLGTPSLSIFVIAEEEAQIAELRRGAESSWTFYSPAPRAPIPTGSARAATRAKQDAYLTFLTEVSLLQNIPTLISAYGSPLGKFLFLTCANPELFIGVDAKSFSPF